MPQRDHQPGDQRRDGGPCEDAVGEIVLCCLRAAAPGVVTHDYLCAVARTSEVHVRVAVHRARRKGAAIRNHRGVGFSIANENGAGLQPVAVTITQSDPDLTRHPASLSAVRSSAERQIEGEKRQ